MIMLMQPSFDKEICAVANEIERYLINHPHAADTLFGIQRWWLLMQRYEQAVQQVQQALDYLETTGIVSKAVVDNGRVIYKSMRNQLPQNMIQH
jgi:hypothetical protein